jgi:hypothetical protein
VKNGTAFKGCTVFRQREICFISDIIYRNECDYRVTKQEEGLRVSEALNLFRLRIAMTLASLTEYWKPLSEFWTYIHTEAGDTEAAREYLWKI